MMPSTEKSKKKILKYASRTIICLIIMATPCSVALAQTAWDHYQKAVDYQAAGDKLNSIEELRLAVELDPENPFYLAALGISYFSNSDCGHAIPALEKAIELNATIFDAHKTLGECLMINNEYEKAIEHLNTALDIGTEDPADNAPIYNDLGQIHEINGDQDKAEEYYLKARNEDPKLPDTYINLGNLYMAKEKYEAAVDAFKTAIRLNPDYAFAHNCLALAYISLENYDLAFEHISIAMELEPENAQFYRNNYNLFVQIKKNHLGSAYVDAGMIKLSLRPEYPDMAIDFEGYCAGGDGKDTACARYFWDLGTDITYSNAQFPSYSFYATGTYNISLTATDYNGAPAKAEIIVGLYNMYSYVLARTQSKYDLAIDGQGYFQIRLPDGNIAYTRVGAFMIDRDGNVVTSSGYYIDPPIFIPPDATDIVFTKPGAVVAGFPGEGQYQEFAGIELARFVNPDGLESIGNNLFIRTEASGWPMTGWPTFDGFGAIRQGFLEVFVSSQSRLDLSIAGEGYFTVWLPDGNIAYTRNGLFNFNQNGELVSANGYRLYPPITIPSDTSDVIVDKEGVVWVKVPGQIAPQEIGAITLVRFPTPESLNRIRNDLFIETAASGAPEEGNPSIDGFGAIRQAFIIQ